MLIRSFLLLLWGLHGYAQESFGRAVLAEVTAYCPCSICCAGTADGVTADGTRTDRVPYGLAADPLVVPYGTLVYLPLGHGALDRVRMDNRFFRVDDTGGSVVTEGREKGIIRLDLRVKEHWWAKKFGRKLMTVYVVPEQKSGRK
jgi:3D (Asp-Asp-Asp) domain-containing protein